MTEQTENLEGGRRGVVLAGGSQFIRDQVARACAAAGVMPALVEGIADALLLDPMVLLVAADGADGALASVPTTRDVIVVGAADDEARTWGRAAQLPSSRVVILPQGGGWLAEHLGRRLYPDAGGSLIGFLGATGGCGVSSFAFWCARDLSRDGRKTLLVDGQPAGGGLEVAIGGEECPGVRWEDLGGIRGTLNADQLASALPGAHDLSVLSHRAPSGDAGPPRPGAEPAGAVLEAARGAFDLTLVDLPSGGGGPLALMCDALVLLVPSRPRGVTAAGEVLRLHPSLAVTAVLRGPVHDGLDGWRVAEMMGQPGPLPLLPFIRGLPGAEASGRMADLGVPRRARRTVHEVCRHLRGSA